MFARLIKQKVQNTINAEENSSYAMAGLELEDSHVFPDVDEDLSAEEKAEVILKQMTLEEKTDMLGGIDNLAIKGNDRLKLPRVWCSDASAGVRCFKRATAFPVPIAMAATWNRDQMKIVGETIAKECRSKGVSILLGPGVNICRVPTCGRNFEYMGEDPYLAAKLTTPYIKGVQSKGVIATIKHFACNNSDYDRHRANSKLDERTLREIYLPAFKEAVKEAGVLSVMSAYNPVNGIFASENKTLLTDILRSEWGFKGFVISDWTSVYDTEKPIRAGLDLEMPKGDYLNHKRIQKLIDAGKLSEQDIDKPVRNLLTTFFKAGIYSRSLKNHDSPEYSDEHSQISLDTARQAVTLLKNKNKLLPLDKSKLSKIAVVGEMAKNTTTCGGGSCCIRSYDKVSILDAILEEAREDIDIMYLEPKKGRPNSEQIKKIQNADVVIVSVGFTNQDESEAYDKSWELPNSQGKLIKTVSEYNDNVVVILTTGTDVETESWIHDIPALLHGYYLGEKGGRAIAEVLFGKTNPSGKLPFTMAKRWEDIEAAKYYVKNPEKISLLRILGPQGKRWIRKIWDMEYGEKLMVGYRHFDTNNVEPQFPFGFGLSYTEFAFSDLKTNPSEISTEALEKGEQLTISLKLENKGAIPGSEVIQLYVKDVESSLPRPEKELKGFEKVHLDPGDSASVEMTIKKEDLMFFDDTKGRWSLEPGKFQVLIGSSSRDLPLQSTFNVTRLKQNADNV